MRKPEATELIPLPCLQGRGRGGMLQAPKSCTTQARRYKPIFRLLRIRPTFSGVRLPAANPHPTLPLQARGGMAQEPEIGTDSPNLFRHCEVVPRGRLVAAPTMASLQTTRFMRHRVSGDRRGFREPAYLHNTDFSQSFPPVSNSYPHSPQVYPQSGVGKLCIKPGFWPMAVKKSPQPSTGCEDFGCLQNTTLVEE